MRVPGSLEPIDRGDIRMVQRSENLGLSLEAGEPLGVSGKLLRQDFDGNVPAKLLVLGSEHFTHTALANGFDDLVVG